ncbi:MAG: DUF2811 domain-containing protein [Coleofasciculaceae cyanobacterium RL_1_1]|nr:DUF2811 domain-containing protein [Coleofasciculaceae cyanobacterium RL_1_1]
MNTNVSILAEIPEDLHLSMQGYLDGNPDWDQDRVFSAAISLFLLQNTIENTPEASLNYRRAARVYLETLFRDKPDALTETDASVSSLGATVPAKLGSDASSDDVAVLRSEPHTGASSAIPDTSTPDALSPHDPQHHIDAA